MENAYAQALWQLVEKGMQPSKAIAALREALEKSGRVSLLPRIGRAFARLGARDERKNGLVLSVAREKDAHRAERAAKEYLKVMNTDADLRIVVDDSLIGGWRLEGREVLVDASFKKQLLDIYQRATRTV